MKFLTHIFGLIFLLTSCNSTKPLAEENLKSNMNTQDILTGSFVVSEISKSRMPDNNITIHFDNNRVDGYSGCNSFFGSYTIENSTISFGPIASSKKYCGGEVSKNEVELFNVLSRVTSYSLNSDVVSFFEKDTLVLKASKTVAKEDSKRASKGQDLGSHYSNESVTYQVRSRTDFNYISISKEKISISIDKALQVIRSYECSEDDWNAIQSILNTIDKTKLNTLKAPTDKRLFDGAAHASLSINSGDMSYMTPSFDEGVPPKTIESLVNKVLAIAEKVKKQ